MESLWNQRSVNDPLSPLSLICPVYEGSLVLFVLFIKGVLLHWDRVSPSSPGRSPIYNPASISRKEGSTDMNHHILLPL